MHGNASSNPWFSGDMLVFWDGKFERTVDLLIYVMKYNQEGTNAKNHAMNHGIRILLDKQSIAI